MSQAVLTGGTIWTASMAEDSDLEHVRRTREGDPEAFARLVGRHQNTVYNVAYRFMRDPGRAEDMTQEAFLKAFRLIKGFRGQCAFSTWLYRVTCSVCLTELKRRKRRREVPLSAMGQAQPACSPAPEKADDAERIRRCVAKLPDKYATAVTLYYLQGISYEETAAIMRIPLGTLKTWMHRARKRLKKVVEQELELGEQS